MITEKMKPKIADLPPLTQEERDDAGFRGQDRAWSAVAGLFDQYAEKEDLTCQGLGTRIKRSRAQVHRWLNSSFNMNINSLGLIAEGLDADLFIDLRPRELVRKGSNHCHPSDEARAFVRHLSKVIAPPPIVGTPPAARLPAAAKASPSIAWMSYARPQI